MTPPAAAPAVQPRPGIAPRRRPPAPARPRRVSGPARPRTAPRARHPAERGLVRSLPAAVGRLAEHRLIDRLIAGKAWIGVVAFALIGIVTLQLLLLQLNRSIGRDLARQGVLQRQNAALSIENSELAIGERIQHEAGALGMTPIPAGDLRFLAPQKGAASKAVTALSAPVQPAESGEGGSSASGPTAGASGERSSSETGSEGGEASAAHEGGGTTGEGSSSEAHSSSSESSTSSEASAGSEGGESHGGASTESSSAESERSSGGGTTAAPTG